MLGRSSAIILIIALTCTACGQGTGQNPSPSAADGLPGFPAASLSETPQAPPKQSLVEMELVQQWQDVLQISDAHVGPGNPWSQISFNATNNPNAFAWAMYRFDDVAAYYRADALQITAKHGPVNPDGSVFLGIADYSRKAWKWLPVELAEPAVDGTAQPVTIGIPADVDPYSPGGNLIVTLASYGQPMLVDKLTLIADEAAPPPLGQDATKGTVADAVEVSWVDPALSYDPDGHGPTTFEYDKVIIERRIPWVPEWTLAGEVPAGVTTFTDVPTDGAEGYLYQVRTVVGDDAGRAPVQSASGWVGRRPIAVMSVSGSAPQLTLDSVGSYDLDATSVLSNFQWTVSYPDDPNFSYTFDRPDESPFQYELSDLTKLTRFDLVVFDDEGLASLNLSEVHDATGFALWSPSLGCVEDDPTEPDPKDRVEGQGPGSYTVRLAFIVNCGIPNFQMELDTHFDGVFGNGPNGFNGQPLPIVMLKSFAQNPNGQGAYDITANIPAAQADGEYYMAVRVTDGDTPPSSWVYMWPDRVVLEPQP